MRRVDRRWMMRTGIALASLGSGVACRTDHDALARSPSVEESSGGTTARPQPMPGPAEDSGTDSGFGPTDAAPAPAVDAAPPSGRRTLTWVHAVTDATDAIQLCFAAVVDGAEAPLGASPVPAAGLAFGASTWFESLEGIDLDVDGLRAYVLAGELERVAGLGCADAVALARTLESESVGLADAAPPGDAEGGADAREGWDAGSHDATGSPRDGSAEEAGGDAVADAPGDVRAFLDVRGSAEASLPPPPLRVRALPVIPAATLSARRSYLLAVGGCLGGAAFSSPSERSICGERYAPDEPTVSLHLVAMSPLTHDDTVGLQCLNATPAFSPITLRAEFIEEGTQRTIATGVRTGQLAPREPRLGWRASQLGQGPGEANLRAYRGGSSSPSYDAPWSATLDVAGLASLRDGRSYTLIVAGPHPGFERGAWWNGAVVTVVPNDPAL